MAISKNGQGVLKMINGGFAIFIGFIILFFAQPLMSLLKYAMTVTPFFLLGVGLITSGLLSVNKKPRNFK